MSGTVFLRFLPTTVEAKQVAGENEADRRLAMCRSSQTTFVSSPKARFVEPIG